MKSSSLIDDQNLLENSLKRTRDDESEDDFSTSKGIKFSISPKCKFGVEVPEHGSAPINSAATESQC